jgi:uncharacterized phage infection (PIP) family protein YhgE
MKTNMKYLALMMVLVLTSSTVLTQQKDESNFEDSDERSFEILYTDENTAYAINDEGEFLYKTTDDGKSWLNIVEPEDGQIKEILFTEPKDRSGKNAGFEEEADEKRENSGAGSEGFMPADDLKNNSEILIINFTLNSPGFVSIKIYDSKGQTIDAIAKSSFGAGEHEVKWNGSKFPKGSYYCSVVTSEYSTTKKLH